MQNNTRRVLVVEDCPGDVFLLEEMLSETDNHDIKITNVPRLIDAFDRIGSETFDVILLDLNLPDIDGVASIAALSAQLPHTPIIVYSGQDNTRLKLNALLCGASNYLVKGRETPATLEKAIMSSHAPDHSEAAHTSPRVKETQ